MFEEQETKGRQEEARAKTGLEILYVQREAGDQLGDIAEWDIPRELRERYWIRKAGDAGTGSGIWTFGISMPWWIERHELGRNRNDPGDGFRYLYRRGTDGRGSRAEWFEVTEIFEGIQAKDIEAFVRVNNGGTANFEFDPDRFVRGLEMGTPGRAAQRRAADKVIDAVEKKVNKASYEGMWRRHGYGTLIVGLPLWFATMPADPLRAENVIDDFMARVGIGLESFARQLKKKSCPFWRIVVVWVPSLESAREWHRKARYEVYDDPAYRSIGGLPVKCESMTPLLLKLMGELELARAHDETVGGLQLHVAFASPSKQAKATSLQLPPAVEAVKRALDGDGKRRDRENLLGRVKWRAMQRAMEVLSFLRAHGLSGLARWAITRLSPRHRVTQLATRRRALRLYLASRQRHPDPRGRPPRPAKAARSR